ncbi:MAG TPA: hypothetical protein VI386_12670 [Candidatus Sulfotelmatobacter sp.]
MTYAYYDGGLVLEIHVRLRGVDSKPRNFRAEFQSLSSKIYDRLTAAGRQLEVKLPLTDLGCDYVEQPVFVKVIEVSEQSEQRREGWVPSIVRLHSFDFCLDGQTEVLDSIPLCIEPIGNVCNRELENSGVQRRVLLGFVNGSSVDEMVKSGPQIMDAVSYEERPSVQRRVNFDFLDEVAVAGTISVDLLPDDVRVAVNPSLEFAIESIGMFFRPTELEPAMSKLRSEHTLTLRC